MLLTTISSIADILGDPKEPSKISDRDSQLLYGEQFQVEQEHGTYVYGHSIHDGYKGYVERALLVKNTPPSNALISVRATHLYPDPDFKSRPTMILSFLSRLTTTGKEENGFSALDDGHWVFTDHISNKDNFKMPDDLAQTATLYLNTPYIYGGRSSLGIDCAGLVQQVMVACGHPCPLRDSKDQEASFGKKIEKEAIQRNDIVYFKGHVGIMMDEKYILNATARHMTTVIEELEILEKAYGGITHIARIDSQ